MVLRISDYVVFLLTFHVSRLAFAVRRVRPRSTMDSIRVSEAPDTGSIPVEATTAFPMF